jgi:hypothetical protein
VEIDMGSEVCGVVQQNMKVCTRKRVWKRVHRTLGNTGHRPKPYIIHDPRSGVSTVVERTSKGIDRCRADQVAATSEGGAAVLEELLQLVVAIVQPERVHTLGRMELVFGALASVHPAVQTHLHGRAQVSYLSAQSYSTPNL